MTVTRYGVCLKCGQIKFKKELTSVAGVVESISYRTDKSCKCTTASRSDQTQEKR